MTVVIQTSTLNRAGFAPAEVQRLSRRIVTTTVGNSGARFGVSVNVLSSSIKACVLLASLVTASAQVNGPTKPTQTEKFVWRYGARELGTFYVPTGFTAETENYREGIVTHLRYPDGSCLVVQRGFMYRIPMFQDPEHVLDSSEKLDAKMVRSGHYADKAEVWGEVDYAPRRPTRPNASIFDTLSPNLGYEHVPRRRGEEFARALATYVSAP
jgi:hypothetical protein